MDLTEKQLSSELLYSGIIVDLTMDMAELCDGRKARREVVHHPGGVSILPLDDEGNCYMVRQYRYPVRDTVLEIPAGKLEKGEDVMVCAVRESSLRSAAGPKISASSPGCTAGRSVRSTMHMSMQTLPRWGAVPPGTATEKRLEHRRGSPSA